MDSHQTSSILVTDSLPSLMSDSPPSKDISTTPSRVKRISTAVEKTVERTVDKLNRSISGKSSSSTIISTPSSSSHRRLFSMSRKGKARDGTDLDDLKQQSDSQIPSPPLSASPSSVITTQVPLPHDDSPFIRPPSPPIPQPNAETESYRGDGSMRAGTQTLIQALHALTYPTTYNDVEILPYDVNAADSESEDEDKLSPPEPLASSIHTIYRPLARSRRERAGTSSTREFDRYTPVKEESPDAEPDAEESPVSEEEEVEAEDFEETTPRIPNAASPPLLRSRTESPLRTQMTTSPTRMRPNRTGSMATVRLQRRARLAAKLKTVFDLDAIDEVVAEMPCWLLRSILLQGYMYLTNSYLCFFAHMPTREDQILKSGSLNKKAQRTKRWIKHWFVLKNDALSWYQSSSDPYFPHGIVDLRYAISCDPLGEKDFRVRTNTKIVVLSAASIPSREEWVKAIRKVIFKAQNSGDSVKIAIPYSAILDVDRSSAMDFSETIEVKVVEKEDHYTVDSYFFAYFHDLPGALEKIRDVVRAHRLLPDHNLPHSVVDTTTSRGVNSAHVIDRAQSLPTDISPPRSASGFRLSSLLRPFHENNSAGRHPHIEQALNESEEYTHVSRRGNSSSFVPVTSDHKETLTSSPSSTTHSLATRHSQEGTSTPTPSTYEHTYPPSTSSSYIYPDPRSLSRESTSWGVMPSWLRGTKKMFSTATGSEPVVAPIVPGSVREVYSSGLSSSGRLGGAGEMAFSVLESPEMGVDAEATDKFRAAFAYDEKETLLGYFSGYIFRLLPVYGKLYISTNFFCFKSSGPLTSRTRMTLPIKDILAVEKSKGTRFGHHGLIVIVKGHEELFFEFGAEDKREAFVKLFDRQLDDVRRRLATGETTMASPGKRDALILEEFDTQSSSSVVVAPPPALPENLSDSLPAVMFTSASSTFLTFKPSKPLHFTFLTIGSRGDVQPYIALAKGLMADGHKCRIATHGEFKEWIEAYGIEFGYVGGDPAELMRICIENGTFTVSFLKEGLLKFRVWIDDLLKTSWEACQGTDVLVESPSAMGGYHIAEALGIPYFRAFTMTWTRTRAYPHAFAVPERKMGGSYNYMSYLMFDSVFWHGTAGQINRWRRNTLHLGGTSLDKMEPHNIPFLYNFSPHVVPPPLDWPEWIRVTGYWFLDDAEVSAKKWTPPPDLVEFIDNAHKLGKKIVYVGFGSIVVSDPKAMTRCVIDAVVQSGVHAILSKGWSDRLHVKTGEAGEVEEPLPSQIYAIPSIPHDWLFKRIDAACHHGGAGTTGASLRAGIPTIIRPFFGDQFFWADRVEALGVGTGVRKLTVSNLAAAFKAATTDIKQIDRAKLLGEHIRAENGVATAIESIYRDLEYARSLVKRTTTEEDVEAVDTEHSTIPASHSPPDAHSGYTSSGSGRRASSEDWSVISEPDERRLSVGSGLSENKPTASKRSTFTSAVFSVLPDALVSSPKASRHRTISSSSTS